VTNANYAGSNLLQNDGTATSDLKVTASYNRVGTTVSIDTINVAAVDTQILDVAGTGRIVGGLLATTFFDPSTARLDDAAVITAINSVETALAKLSTGAAILGAAKNTVTLQTSFVSKLSDAIDRGVAAMIDADINAESARLSALQVQQQLGVQALSIANSNSENILALFRH
jgi:flagellin